jgi:hypothetical protein
MHFCVAVLPCVNMEGAQNKVAELRVKHLEMVQANIARMSNHSASLKNYCVTLVTAVCGFAVTLQRPLVALVALLAIITFALLDAQYLRVERRFRGLFDLIRTGDWKAFPSFEINLKAAPLVNYRSVVCSWSILIFYGPLACAVVVVVLTAEFLYGRLL